MPPVHESDAVDRVQDHLKSLISVQLLSPEHRRVLEVQSNSMVPHVCAHIYVELKEKQTEMELT